MSTADELRRALVAANPAISRYNPLPRILFHDDFDRGLNGWCELIGNHDGNLDKVRPVIADMRPPQLSNMSFFDIGTHGAVDGTYAMKLATRARAHHMALAIKRLTYVKPGLVQFETYFAIKSEAWIGHLPNRHAAYDGNVDPSGADFGDFTIGNDVCDVEFGRRYHCAIRYLNTDDDGRLVRKWMYKTSLQTSTRMVLEGAPHTFDYHVAHPDDWAEVPDGQQALCYNELPTKINWHYLRYVFDTAAGRNVELQVNDKTMDLRALPVPTYPKGYWGLEKLLNFCVDVRTHRDVRNFIYLDSVLVSVDW